MSGVIQGLYFQILELELMLETEKWERTKLEESINLEMEERKELERILQLDWDLNTKLDVYYIELIESMLEVAKQKNEILEDQCCKLVDKVNSLSKQLYVTDQKKESYLRSYRECLQEKHILKCDIYQNNLLAKELKEKLGYCYENNGNLSLATRENMSDILKQVNEMCQSLKLMGKARIRRIDTIVKIKNKLGEYETLFYINNLLLDQEVRGFCNKINNILNDWEDYYRRYNWRETAKPVENQELYQIAEISSILKYITLYKVFDSSPKDIMHIDDVYNLLIDRCVFSTNYRLSRFRKEIKFLVENEKIE
ncbi:hypothetical protein ACS52_07555, partial [Bacillus cereus]